MGRFAGWEGMRESSLELLERTTGQGLQGWNAELDAAAARGARVGDEPGLRRWLDARGVHGYAQSAVVMERLGYPPWFTADGDDLVEAQYADRPALRPVLDAVLDAVAGLAPLTLQARKGYVSLVARRQLAVVRASTRSRVDVGLRLADPPPDPRLQPARGLGNATVTVRLGLSGPQDVDAGVRALLHRAHRENC